jgi:hypothetical protein
MKVPSTSTPVRVAAGSSRDITNALFRPAVERDDTPGLAWPVMVVDVSDRALCLRVSPKVDVTPSQLVELGVGDVWRRGRIAWSRHGVREAVIVSVEFAEPAPDILAALVGARVPAALAS